MEHYATLKKYSVQECHAVPTETTIVMLKSMHCAQPGKYKNVKEK